MTRLFIILVLALIFSCKQSKRSKEHAANFGDTTTANNIIASNFYTATQLPGGFTLDSTISFDSSRNAEIQIVIPKCKGVTLFNKQVTAYMKQRLKKYRLSLDTLFLNEPSMLQAAPGGFYVEPGSVFKDDKIISYCFMIDSDYPGAFHPFIEYYSFNYDLKKNKPLGFSDCFNVRSKQDTQSFISIINRAIDRPNIEITKLDGIDFNIEKDSIDFNFDDYEIASYAEGIIKAKVAKQKLKQFMTDKN